MNNTLTPYELNLHKARIHQRLLDLGVSKYALMKNEARRLPNIIHKDEKIGGVAYGRSRDGFVMLVATDRRVIYLDTKPMFVNEDEISFDMVSGVNISSTAFDSTLTLHTRIRDYKIRTFNQRTTQKFVQYIEKRCLEHMNGERRQTQGSRY